RARSRRFRATAAVPTRPSTTQKGGSPASAILAKKNEPPHRIDSAISSSHSIGPIVRFCCMARVSRVGDLRAIRSLRWNSASGTDHRQPMLLQEALEIDDDPLDRAGHQHLATMMSLDGEVDAAALHGGHARRGLYLGPDRCSRQMADVDGRPDGDLARFE